MPFLKFEKTETFTKWSIGNWYLTKTKRNKSEAVVIYLIENQHRLTDIDLQQSIDYLEACKDARIRRPSI